MKNYFEVLRSCLLFEGITDEGLLSIPDCLGVNVQSYGKNQTIIAEGGRAEQIGIVLSGAVQIARVDYYGNRSILTELCPGQLFGESFACAEVERIPVNVVAAQECEVMLFDARRILHMCGNACGFHNQMIFNLMKAAATKNLVFHQKLEIISKRTTRERLMTYLLQQEKFSGSSFQIPFDRQELADFLEVDRSGLSAEIGKLRKEGILECKRSRFTLLR